MVVQIGGKYYAAERPENGLISGEPIAGTFKFWDIGKI
jgi:hypothetical protein